MLGAVDAIDHHMTKYCTLSFELWLVLSNVWTNLPVLGPQYVAILRLCRNLLSVPPAGLPDKVWNESAF